MARIVDKNKTKRIDLGNNEWIDVRSQISYKEFGEIQQLDFDDPNSLVTVLKRITVNWNLLDDDGNPIGFKSELIEQFDIETVTESVSKAMEIYSPKKKAENDTKKKAQSKES